MVFSATDPVSQVMPVVGPVEVAKVAEQPSIARSDSHGEGCGCAFCAKLVGGVGPNAEQAWAVSPVNNSVPALLLGGDYVPPYPGQTFSLHSRPGATRKIYLDFTGHTTFDSGVDDWDTYYNGSTPIVSPVFSFEGDTSFSTNEEERIQRIWQRVAEDFSPFDVDVTTQDPGISGLTFSSVGDTTWGTRVVVAADDAWIADDIGFSIGGVAFLDSFQDPRDLTCFVFAANLGSWGEKSIAEAISHEVGHTLGLNHDGTSSQGYYAGHDGSGTPGWAPIMGVGYDQELAQWSKGEYADADNGEDDLDIITNTAVNFDYRLDDAGNTIGSATPANVSGTDLSFSGVIERTTDVDVLRFNAGVNDIAIGVLPWVNSPNLDIRLELRDSAGTILAESDPLSSLSASVLYSITAPGQYFLFIEGVGVGNEGTYGYTDYGSLGQYTVVGNLDFQPLVVSNAADSGAGSLRAAIESANTNPGNDVIRFDSSFFATPRTINLLSMLPSIANGDLIIENTTGAANAIVKRSAGTFGILNIETSSENVTIDGLTIQDGNSGDGSAITVSATTSLTLENSIITGNTGGIGAIYLPSGATGTLTIDNTTIRNNTNFTGGIYFFRSGSLIVRNSTIADNVGTGTESYQAGGIVFYGDVGSSGVSIENSTIHNNTSASSSGGGGINFRSMSGNAVIRNSTITGNTAISSATGGGGVGLYATSGTLSIVSTVIAGNSGPANGPDLLISAGAVTASQSFFGVLPPSNFTGPDSLTGNPNLGPLMDNGGPTHTRMPNATSPLIDAGANPAGLATDQRGIARVLAGVTDIGSVEVAPSGAPTVTINQGSSQAGLTNSSPIEFHVVFSQPVNGFIGSDIKFTGSTVGGSLSASVTQTGSTTYTVFVTGMSGAGTVVASLLAGAATDAGDATPSEASNSTDNSVTFDNVAPGVTITQGSSQSDPIVSGPVIFDVVFTEGVAGFSESDISFAGSTVGGLTATVTQLTPATYTVVVTGYSGTGTIVVSIPLEAAFDGAGNLSTASALSDNTVTIVSSAGFFSLDSATYTPTEEGGTFSASVSRTGGDFGPVTLDFAVTNGTASGTDYTVTTAGSQLSWGDGDSTTQDIDFTITNDLLSEGKETFTINLSNLSAGSAGIMSALVTILQSDGKPAGKFTYADGDVASVSLLPKTGAGSLLVYLTNDVAPISLIELTGTNPAKTKVAVTVKKVSDGIVDIGEVEGTGVASLNLRQSNLTGAGVNLTGPLGTLRLNAVSGGADIVASGSIPKKSTHITVKTAIADGTDITLQQPLGSLKAAAYGTGLITVPSVGSITIKGNLSADITVSGAGLDPVKNKAIRSIRVGGIVDGSDIMVGSNAGSGLSGNVGSVTVGSFINSRLFANFIGNDDGSPANGFHATNKATIGSFRTTTKSASAFQNSSIIASRMNSVTLSGVTTNNADEEFGIFVDDLFKNVSIVLPTRVTYRNSIGDTNDDFSVQVV